jgi:hypothetical protein
MAPAAKKLLKQFDCSVLVIFISFTLREHGQQVRITENSWLLVRVGMEQMLFSSGVFCFVLFF